MQDCINVVNTGRWMDYQFVGCATLVFWAFKSQLDIYCDDNEGSIIRCLLCQETNSELRTAVPALLTQLALRCITFPIHEIRCKWIRTLNGSKWAIYHQILTCENWDMATLVSWQECLETTFIEVFNNIWTHFWNLWNFLWTILPSVEPKYALL